MTNNTASDRQCDNRDVSRGRAVRGISANPTHQRLIDLHRALLAGATGYVGSRLAAELLKGGHEVIAATRNPGRLAPLRLA